MTVALKSRDLGAAQRVHRDPLCRFYTGANASSLLVHLMDDEAPEHMLDLACGEGALGAAALRRWPSLKMVSVDINPLLTPKRVKGHRHIVADALSVGLADLGRQSSGFDAVICNPPFGLSTWRNHYHHLLAEAGFDSAFQSRARVSAEALFTAQCIRLTRKGGMIGLVVPDGLITGRRSEGFRRALMASHEIRQVIQLPSNSFTKTEARAFLLSIRKGHVSDSPIALNRLEANGDLGGPLFISQEAAVRRMDYDFHHVTGEGRSLADLAAHVVRGTVDPGAAARGIDVPLFHTRDFPNDGDRKSHVLQGTTRPSAQVRMVIAEPGDILVARVDRSLHRKVCGVSEGYAALTSSVFRIRVEESMRDKVLSALLSDVGATRLASTARGVGPRMLGKSDLMSMVIPW